MFCRFAEVRALAYLDLGAAVTCTNFGDKAKGMSSTGPVLPQGAGYGVGELPLVLVNDVGGKADLAALFQSLVCISNAHQLCSAQTSHVQESACSSVCSW